MRVGLPFQVLHNKEVDAVLLADVMERADVGMIQRGDGAGFAFKAFASLWVGSHVSGQDFDRHCAIQPRVARPIDFAHAARSDRSNYLVRSEPSSDSQRHRSSPAFLNGHVP
jgi:hypothetical protein